MFVINRNAIIAVAIKIRATARGNGMVVVRGIGKPSNQHHAGLVDY